jgi:hypothetical protein
MKLTSGLEAQATHGGSPGSWTSSWGSGGGGPKGPLREGRAAKTGRVTRNILGHFFALRKDQRAKSLTEPHLSKRAASQVARSQKHVTGQLARCDKIWHALKQIAPAW